MTTQFLARDASVSKKSSRNAIVFSCLVTVPGLLFALNRASAEDNVANSTDQISYVIGRTIGAGLKKDGIALNTTVFTTGVQSVLEDKPSKYSDEETRMIMQKLQSEVIAKKQAAAKTLGDANLTEGKAFLEKNAKAQGVKTTPSGLQYKVITSGDGASPTLESTVVANYKGTLINGTEFDSSYARKSPATFPIKNLIKGWQEALVMMKPGSKWELVVPPSLAYGENGAGELIGPNATLKFEIELLEVKK